MLLATLLFCASCDRPAIEPADSLVGATDMPSAKQLSQEAIEINRGFGGGYGFGEHFLSYQLRADNLLTVVWTFRPDDDVRGRESFRLPSDVAENARRALWRLRPKEAGGMDHDVRPTGCTSRSPHDLGEMVVLYTEADEERFRLFTSPYPGSCDNAAAKEARKVIRDVLASFPHSDVATAYSRAEAADEAR
jgi:hypothetical protein